MFNEKIRKYSGSTYENVIPIILTPQLEIYEKSYDLLKPFIGNMEGLLNMLSIELPILLSEKR